MKLYDGGRAPNPRRVRVFLAEKGIEVPTEQVDLGAMEHKKEPFSAINPMQRVPVLVLDDGTIISAAISRCCNPTRLCSAAARWEWPWSKCGTGAPKSICFSR
jgi:hypothetical protein